MTYLRKLLDRRPRGDHGLTLAELAVTMLILGILGTALVTSVKVMGRAIAREQTKGSSLDIARLGMNRMSKSVRAGTELIKIDGSTDPAFVEIAPEKVTLYASFGATPTKMSYYVNANRELVEQTWSSSGTGALADQPPYTFTATPRTTVIASKITAGTAVPLFKFLNTDGVAISTQTSTSTAVTSLVRQVDITLDVNYDPSRGAPSAVLNESIVLPNLGVLKR
jgi:prepilin-type N-terminal cleavage/methylation domain-containing protein